MTERDNALKELGRQITERRESIGMTLETVFDRTKIRPEYLRGIEEGDYTNFPEIVYIKGFVRTYLKLIGAEDMQDEFMTQLDRTQGTKKQDFHEIRTEKQSRKKNNILGSGSNIPKGFKPASHFWLFLVLVAALIGTGAYVWYAVTYGGLDLKNMKLFNFSGAGGPMTGTEILSDDFAAVSDDIAEPVSVDEVVSEEPEPEIKPSLEIHAANDVWLSVAFGNAQPVYRRTLKKGEVMRWDLNEPARVSFGRPTAAQVILNGKDLGIVNPSGRRAETYIYNPDGTFRKASSR